LLTKLHCENLIKLFSALQRSESAEGKNYLRVWLCRDESRGFTAFVRIFREGIEIV
jgi:hypothetical protein